MSEDLAVIDECTDGYFDPGECANELERWIFIHDEGRDSSDSHADRAGLVSGGMSALFLCREP